MKKLLWIIVILVILFVCFFIVKQVLFKDSGQSVPAVKPVETTIPAEKAREDEPASTYAPSKISSQETITESVMDDKQDGNINQEMEGKQQENPQVDVEGEQPQQGNPQIDEQGKEVQDLGEPNMEIPEEEVIIIGETEAAGSL